MTWNKKKDIFALMTGHGKSLDGSWDPGCTYNGYTEAALMQKITKVAVGYLRESGIKVISDSDNNNNKNMVACVEWANREGAKYYMSVHCDYSGASAGVFPLYVSSTGKTMASKIGKAVAKSMKMDYKGAGKRTDLYELNATNMTAIIFETGAIKADLGNLKSHKRYGKALAKAICNFLGVTFVDKEAKKSGITLPSRGYFKLGDSSSKVKTLQTWLKNHGFNPGALDGEYGAKTIAAVKKFQKKYKMAQDGLFGEDCLKKADSLS